MPEIELDPPLEGSGVDLYAYAWPDQVRVGDAFTTRHDLLLSGEIDFVSPTDPDYCLDFLDSGRQVDVQVIGNGTELSRRTMCIPDALTIDRRFRPVDVPVPDDASVGDIIDLEFNYIRPSDGSNYFGETFTASTEVVESGPTDPGGDDPGEQWEEIPEDEPLEEGDVIRSYTCIHAPEIPGDELIAQFTIGLAELTGQLNNQLPECTDVTIIDKNLFESDGIVVDGNECEFIYVVEYRIDRIEDECVGQIDASLIHGALLLALAVFIAAVGISLVLWRTEKLVQQPGGGDAVRNVSLAALLAAGAYLVSTSDEALDQPSATRTAQNGSD